MPNPYITSSIPTIENVVFHKAHPEWMNWLVHKESTLTTPFIYRGFYGMTLQRILGTTHGGYSNDIQLHSNRWSSCRCRWSGLRMTQWLSQTRPRHPWPWFVVGMWQGYWRPKLLDESNVATRLRLNQVATWLEFYCFFLSSALFAPAAATMITEEYQPRLQDKFNVRVDVLIDAPCLPLFWGHLTLPENREQQVSDGKWRKRDTFSHFFISFPFSFFKACTHALSELLAAGSADGYLQAVGTSKAIWLPQRPDITSSHILQRIGSFTPSCFSNCSL